MEQFFLHLAGNSYFAAAAGLSIGIGVVIFLVSRYGTRLFFPGGTSMEANALARVEKKVDEVKAQTDTWIQQHIQCREWQRDNFITVKIFEEWQKGREPLWKRLNRHAHDPATGKVIITED